MGDQTLVIGAGPAGLTAGYELMKAGVNTVILEVGAQTGGMSRTVEHDGFRFDLGPHRFYTKIPQVQALWEELLGDRLVLRPRLSRIAYRGQLFHYPLRPLSALRQLGPATALAIFGSFARARLAPIRPEDSFEAWVTNRFGRRLYEMFFKTYTEKVWGIPCTELSADWAAQRIRELSLRKVLTEKLFNSRRNQSHSLIDQFHYPPLGPQEMWDEIANRLASGGQSVMLGRRVSRVRIESGKAVGLSATGPEGAQEDFDCDAVISTMPLHELVQIIDPPPPDEVLKAARGLRYRGHITVCVVAAAEATFEDNWIYIHSPDIRMARLQNFTNWSEHLSPEPGHTALGLEYLAWPGDELWNSPDEDLISLAIQEFGELQLMPADSVRKGWVERSPHAYPVYDPGYSDRVATIRRYLETIPNIITCGRCGMHRYNNMDHSMLTGLLAARNICGDSQYIWSVNLESEYVEERQGSR